MAADELYVPNSELVKSPLEILPGLVVEPRWINDNWWLIPVSEKDQLPDVEAMLIHELGRRIGDEPTEVSYDEICCLINALAHRREAQTDALRNIMGLLATDKPTPLTEVPPYALVEGDDQLLNELPTSELTGVDTFDFIQYGYYAQKLPVRHEGFPTDWAYIDHPYYQIFKHGDHVRIWLEDKLTGDVASVVVDTVLQHWSFEFPEDIWHCYTFDRYSFKKNPGETFFNIFARRGPYEIDGGEGGTWQDTEPGGPLYFYKNKLLTEPCTIEREYRGPEPYGDWQPDKLSIWIDAFDIVPGAFEDRVHVTEQYKIVVEFVDKSIYEVLLALSYFNHDFGDIVMETRSFIEHYPDMSRLAEVAAAEIILLDDMRLNGLINSPQWVDGKQQLEQMASIKITW